MKRLMRLCCCLLVLLLLPVTAQADVIYMPFDSFYDQHMADCTYVSRNYKAKGPNGDVTLYVSPEDAQVEAVYPNGTALYVSYTYQAGDGVLWGCCDNWDDGSTGWAPMEYLELIYDEKSFSEEYGHLFVPVQVALDAEELTGKTVYFWNYPGSPDYIEVEMSADYRPEFQQSYTDEKGMEWIRCGYCMAIKGKWVNLNNPTADYDSLYPQQMEETVPAETAPAPTELVEEIKPAGNGEKLTVILAVTAVAAITAVMLVVLKKKK